jgi:hypothetical protein
MVDSLEINSTLSAFYQGCSTSLFQPTFPLAWVAPRSAFLAEATNAPTKRFAALAIPSYVTYFILADYSGFDEDDVEWPDRYWLHSYCYQFVEGAGRVDLQKIVLSK